MYPPSGAKENNHSMIRIPKNAFKEATGGMARKVDAKKEEEKRLHGLLQEMLKEDENKYCADCQAKTPRWASYNLGVFLCIRCAGIHRNLGVHISKVRSVTLDSWTCDQVRMMQEMGNERARAIYEASLPDGFRRPSTDHSMEQFIRAKYEQKRYYSKDGRPVPPPTRRVAVAATGHSVVKSATPKVQKDEPCLLDFSSPSSANNNTSTSKKSGVDALADPFGELSVQTPEVDDPFGEFVSAPSVSSAGGGGGGGGFANFDSVPAVSVAAPPPSVGNFASFDVAPPPAVAAPSTNGGAIDLFAAAPAAPAASSAGDLFGLDMTSAPSGTTNSQISPSLGLVSDGPKSTSDILSLFGGSASSGAPAPAFSGMVATGGFPATAYGLSQFSAPAQQPQPAYSAPPTGQAVPAHNFGMMSGFGAAPPVQNVGAGLAGLQLGGFHAQPTMQAAAQPVVISPGPAPMQTRAMKAFDGIDKSMFSSAAYSKPKESTPPAPAHAAPMFSQSPPSVVAQPVAASTGVDDLLGLF